MANNVEKMVECVEDFFSRNFNGKIPINQLEIVNPSKVFLEEIKQELERKTFATRYNYKCFMSGQWTEKGESYKLNIGLDAAY